MDIKFFLSPYKKPAEANYQHLAVVLAEGFRERQITFYGNINYWFCLDQQEYLIKAEPNGFNADIHVYTTSYLAQVGQTNIQNNKVNVLLDASDGIFTEAQDSAYQEFDYILRTHYNQYFNYPDNVVPWAFGLTKRMIDSCGMYAQQPEKVGVLQNFRVDHSLRKHMIDHLNPLLNQFLEVQEIFTQVEGQSDKHSFWAQTGRRHHEEFFKLINSSKYTYVFGGELLPRSVEPHYYSAAFRLIYRIRKALFNKLNIQNRNYVLLNQFDSWRLWEGLCSSTVPIHLDLEEYGCVLPVMPQNWTHYAGVSDVKHLNQFSAKIRALTDKDLTDIADNGKQWCIDNYSPKVTATRFLSIVN